MLIWWLGILSNFLVDVIGLLIVWKVLIQFWESVNIWTSEELKLAKIAVRITKHSAFVEEG
jgi:hypothetical protein